MLPWMCGRQTLTIVVSSPCMTQAQITVAVVAARLATGREISPLKPPAFAAGPSSSRKSFRNVYGRLGRLSRDPSSRGAV